MKTKRIISDLFLICVLSLLLGCGGGGGGGDDDGGGDSSGPAWSSPFLLESSGLTADIPQVAGDDAGNFMVVWRQPFAGRFNIYARRYTPAGGWGAAVALDGATEDSFNPQVAADGTGNFAAVWDQNDGVYARRFASGSWGAVKRLDDGIQASKKPQVAANGSGNFMVVWEEGSFGTDIYARRFNDGGPAVAISTDESFNPQVAADGSGNFMAVWEQVDPGDSSDSIFTNRFDSASGTWEGAEAREALAEEGFNPQVASDGSSDFIIVWEQDDGSFNSIYYAYYDESGSGWGGASALESLSNDSWEPQIAGDGGGSFAVVWVRDDGSFDSIYGANYEPGTGWGSQVLLESMDDDASIPQVAADSFGNYMAVWAHDDGGADDIWALYYDVGTGSWGSTPELVDERLDDANAPQVAGGSDNFMAVWSQGDGTAESIFASLFE